MNNTDRKMLTEWLGECWHDMREYKIDDTYSVLRCKKCGFIGQRDYRTFDNWQDYGALIERLKELRLWEEYHAFTRRTWFDGNYGSNTQCDEYCYTEWLLDSVRCQKIAEFLRRRK